MRKFVPIALLVALILAGCGSKPDPVLQYKQQVNSATAQLGTKLAPIAASISTTSTPSADANVMHQVATDLHQLSQKLATIKVPEKKTALQTDATQLRSEIDSYADAVNNSAGQDATGFKNQTKLFTASIAGTIQSINNQR